MGNKFPKDTDYRGIVHAVGKFSLEKINFAKSWRTSHPMRPDKSPKDIAKAVWCGHKIRDRFGPHCIFEIKKIAEHYYRWYIAFGQGYTSIY
jgi:hypothetical protein